MATVNAQIEIFHGKREILELKTTTTIKNSPEQFNSSFFYLIFLKPTLVLRWQEKDLMNLKTEIIQS